MKNVVKISILTAMITVAMFFFGGCSEDEGPSLVSGSFNGTVTATIDPEGFDLSPIKFVEPWNSPKVDWSTSSLHGEQIGDPVAYSNNKFTINLPDPPPSKSEWVDIKYALENYLGLSGTLNCSDPKVQVTDVDFIARTGEGYVGYFLNTSPDKKTTCFYIYTDGDVTITGGNVSMSLKEGWNRVYNTDSGKGKVTTKAPDGDMKWYYQAF